MEKGTVLFHTEFRFTDGDIGEKLIIILNNPDPTKEPYLVSRVIIGGISSQIIGIRCPP